MLFSLLAFEASASFLSGGGMHAQVLQKHEQVGASSVQQISEEVESELENDFELATVILPFTVSCFTLHIFHTPFIAQRFATETLRVPIFLSVRSFRI